MRPIFILLIIIVCFKTSAQSINLSTGQAVISMPLYNLQEGALSVPISLNYNSSGLKVDETSSNVGLNWNLNAGGYISRRIRDKADENRIKIKKNIWGNSEVFRGSYYAGLPTSTTLNTDQLNFAVFKDFEPDIFYLNISGQSFEFFIKPIQPPATLGECVLIDQSSDIKIELIAPTGNAENKLDMATRINSFHAFKVTMPDGTIYKFGLNHNEKEYVFSYNLFEEVRYFYQMQLPIDGYSGFEEVLEENGGLNLAAPVTWHLSKIISPKKGGSEEAFQEINFTYRRTKGIPPGSIHIHTPIPSVVTSEMCNNIPKYQISPFKDRPIHLISELKEINSDLYKITFNSTEGMNPSNATTLIPDFSESSTGVERKDIDANLYSNDTYLPAGRTFTFKNVGAGTSNVYVPNWIRELPNEVVLKNILIEDKINQKKVGYYLDHEYFKEYSFITTTQERVIYNEGRLKLKGVYPMKFVNGAEIENGTRFSYDGNVLPERVSLARDRWGFYNRQDLNNISNKMVTSNRGQWGGDLPICSVSVLDPSLEGTQTGMLTAITLPTGGQIRYIYELHDCSNYYDELQMVNNVRTKIGYNKPVGGLRVREIHTYDSQSDKKYITKYTYQRNGESSGMVAVWPADFWIDYMNSGWNLNQSGELSEYYNGSYISYKYVKEEDVIRVNPSGIGDKNNGYIEYEFANNEFSPVVLYDMSTTPAKAIDPTINTSATGICYERYHSRGMICPPQAADINDNVPFISVCGPNTGLLPKYDFLKGALLKTRYYKREEDNSFKLQKEIVNDYGVTYTGQTIAVDNFANSLKFETYSNIINLNDEAYSLMNLFGQVANFPSAFTTAIKVVELIQGLTSNLIDISTYSYAFYYVKSAKVRLNKTTQIEYDKDGAANNAIKYITDYYYGSTKHQLPTTTTSYSVSARNEAVILDKAEVQTKYSFDYTVPISATNDEAKGILALNKKFVLTPIESVIKRNDKVIGASYVSYYGAPSNYESLTKDIYNLEIEEPLQSFTMSNVDGSGSFTRSTLYQKVSEITEYSEKGFLKKSQLPYGANSPFISYSYNNSFFQGYLPNEVKKGSGTSGLSTTFDYNPLFGVSKVKAPDNSFVTYQYDGMGRIESVKDFEEKYLKSNSYKFAAPIAPTNLNIPLYIIGHNYPERMTYKINLANQTTFQRSTMPNKINVEMNFPANVKSGTMTVSGPNGDLIVMSNFGDLLTFPYGFFSSNGSYTIEIRLYSAEFGMGNLLTIHKKTFSITGPPQSLGISSNYNPSNSLITLNWSYSNPNEVASYDIREVANSGNNFTNPTINTTSSTLTYPTIISQASYTYEVKANLTNGTSTAWQPVTVNLPNICGITIQINLVRTTKILTGQTVIDKACQEITLDEGFETETDSDYTTEIGN